MLLWNVYGGIDIEMGWWRMPRSIDTLRVEETKDLLPHYVKEFQRKQHFFATKTLHYTVPIKVSELFQNEIFCKFLDFS